MGEEVMMFWVGLFIASIVYYFIWGKKTSSIRYTPKGNAYITDGSGYAYPGMSNEPTKVKRNGSGFLNFILISFLMGTLAYGLLGDIHKGLSGFKYVFFLGIGALLFLIYYAVSKARREYLSMPTTHEYAKDSPSCKTSHGYSCNQCGSRSIRNWGVDGANDTNRVFICNHCGTHLYRN
jgi:hypothetical protein